MKERTVVFALVVLFLAGCVSDDSSRNVQSKNDGEQVTKKNSNTGETSDNSKKSGDGRSERFKTLSRGEKVNMSNHVVKGKYTVVKFTADW